MKGFMLFFMMFGFFFTVANNDDVKPQVIEQQVIEEVKPEVEEKKEQHQVVSKPVSNELTDPVIDKDAVYTADVELISDINQAREIPLFAKDGFVYYYTTSWNGEGYDLCLTKAAIAAGTVESGKASDEVIVFTNYPAEISTYYVYPMKDGGYIGMGNAWGRDANYSEYLLKYDETGRMIDMRNVAEIYPIDYDSTYFDKVVSDGTNLYVLYQGYTDSKSYGGIIKFDGNFESAEEIFDAEWAHQCLGNDGLMYVVDGYSGEIWSYDSNTNTKLCLGQNDFYSYYVFPGQGNEVLFGYDKLYSFNTRTFEIVELFAFEDLGVNLDSCDLICRDKEGNIVVIYASYTEPNMGVYKAVIKSVK